MTDTSMTPAPIAGKQRYGNLDFIRGVALFGILLMNIHWMANGFDPYITPTIMADETGTNLWVWITTSMVFEGTQRSMFSILFGAGVVLLTSRLEAAGRMDVADIYYRRIIWMLIMGLVHSILILWLGDILYYYALCGFFLYPFRNVAAKSLLILGFAILVLSSLWRYSDYTNVVTLSEQNTAAQSVLAEGGTLNHNQQAVIEGWQSLRNGYAPNEAEIAEMNTAHRGSYLDTVKFIAAIKFSYSQGGALQFMLDLISMMFMGMALFKMRVLTMERSTRFYLAMVAGGYSVGLTMNYYEVTSMIAANFELMAVLKHGLTYDIGRLAMVIGHLGLLTLFCRSGWFSWLRNSMAAVGRMALTSYVSHSIITSIMFNGFGFGLWGTFERFELYFVVFGIWIFQLIISPIWLKYYRFGPLEWLWRSLTYVKRQPMRRQDFIGATVQVKS